MNKRVGRPVKPAPETGRVALSLRVSAPIKKMLDRAATNNGRSLSQEAELRIERSFDLDLVQVILRSTINEYIDDLRAIEARKPVKPKKP